MNRSEEYLSWDLDDQGIDPYLPSCEEGKSYDGEDDDDVFARDEEQEKSQFVQREKPIVKTAVQDIPVSPRISSCSAQWSITHRCLDCAWRAQRGGRPKHPLPSLINPPESTSPTLVTLQSLGTTRDSGYEPSPTSAFSFTFTSDDDDTEVDEEPVPKRNTFVVTGVTPPINIPSGGMRHKNVSVKSGEKCWGAGDESKELPKGAPSEKKLLTIPPTPLRRSKSVPELWASEIMMPKTPIVVRNGEFLRAPPPTPVHGRNSSLPATTADGRPLFTPSPATQASRSSREGLIDLTEDGQGNSGHHRRVLVLALPDLLVDLEPLQRNDQGSFSSTSSARSPSGNSTSSKDTHHSSPSRSRLRPVHAQELRSLSTSSSPSSASSESCDILASRPTWRRPRALSCDVTLEVEFGQELRRVADNFSRNHFSRQGGMWHALRNSLGRRLSFGGTNTVQEAASNLESSEERTSQSLPTTPYHVPGSEHFREYF